MTPHRLSARLVASATVNAVTFVGMAALLLTGCGARQTTDALGLPISKPVSRQLLQDRPEASLLYPGSRPVLKVGADEQKQQGDAREPDPAFAGVVAATSSNATSLLDWYSAQLRKRGYLPATYYPLSTQITGRSWTIPHTKDQIQVAVYRDGQGPAKQVGTGLTQYEEILVAYRVTGPPPDAK